MSGPIASAVVLPDPVDAAPPASPNALKRRQSSVTEASVKRARTNSDAAETQAPPKRRERGRERRLFGAVLGALSQNPTTAGQKRRSEIEKRQLAQRRQEDEESEQRKSERVARRKTQRWKEQKRFERVAMKARHDNMLHLAHFLCTKTEPRLYYKPWEMGPEETDSIDDQLAEARATIQREVDEYEDRQEEEKRRERRATPDETTYHGGEDAKSERADTTQSLPADNAANGNKTLQDEEMQDRHAEESTDQPAQPLPTEPAMDTTDEPEPAADEPLKDADEEVVEAAEDTVIY